MDFSTLSFSLKAECSVASYSTSLRQIVLGPTCSVCILWRDLLYIIFSSRPILEKTVNNEMGLQFVILFLYSGLAIEMFERL
jgi:hypothetical protein